MSGRVLDADEFVFSGGMTELDPSSTQVTGTTRKNKLFRAQAGVATPMSVQLSYQLIGTEQNFASTFPRLFAEVSWQVGSGVQSAIVDVPSSFVVSAAEILDITAKLVADPGATVRVFGTAAPCQAPTANRPTQTGESESIGSGSFGSIIAVPQFAVGLHLHFSSAANLSLIKAIWSCRSDSFNSASIETFPNEDTVPVPGNARGVSFQNTSLATVVVTPVWELAL